MFFLELSIEKGNIIRACLMEPLYGFSCEVEKITSEKVEFVEALYNRLKQIIKNNKAPKITLNLSEKELAAIIKLLKATMDELEISEFQTRTGYDFEEAETLLKELLQIYNKKFGLH